MIARQMDISEQPPETAEQPQFTGVSIQSAREYVNTGKLKGVFCPCCNQFAKIYKRQIHSTIAKMLIRTYLLWKNNTEPNQYHHLSFIIDGISSTGINDFSKLKYWNLIEELPIDHDKKIRTSGYWRITERGRQFVRNETTIAKYALIFDDKLIRFEEPMVNIRQCLGKKFNYDELMKEIIQ